MPGTAHLTNGQPQQHHGYMENMVPNRKPKPQVGYEATPRPCAPRQRYAMWGPRAPGRPPRCETTAAGETRYGGKRVYSGGDVGKPGAGRILPAPSKG